MQKQPNYQSIRTVALFFLSNNSTVRDTANFFYVSKSTVHNYLHKYLKDIDYNLYKKVQKQLDNNFSEKHLRGGNATKIKFENKKGTV